MTSAISFSFFVQGLLAVVFQGSIHISIEGIKGANIHNNIQTVIFNSHGSSS